MPREKRLTVRSFRKMKESHEKIVQMTAYDALFARLAETAGVDQILVGDSLGMSALGFQDTIPVTMNDMIRHTQAVRRGAPHSFVIGDMPFLSYHTGTDAALVNAGRFLQEADADAVKLECTASTVPTVMRLTDAGIPVVGHIGLLPQSLKVQGGYRIAGRERDDAERLLTLAKELQKAGCFSLVLECMPSELAKIITESLDIPTIGIGAGPHTDGQVQVVSDLLGLVPGFLPKHAKRYADFADASDNAFRRYVEEVKSGVFPAPENSFD